ncbi:glycosyltransferase, partial [Escherichia coli]|nr:glycosyltransferase [Escherichia coli]
MKVTIVNTQEIFGGAAIAAKRLYHGLREFGINTEYVVMNKSTNENMVIGALNKKERIFYRIRSFLEPLPIFGYRKKNSLFSVAWWSNRKLIKRLNKSDSDIIHLHWVNAGFLSVKDIGRINKPVVITLHDMWYFTGGCHYSNGCQRFKQKCGKCPVLDSKFKFDISYYKKRQKQSVYTKNNVKFVALSRWIGKQFLASNIMPNAELRIIPNPLDLERYQSIPKIVARELLGLPQNKKVIMFGAVNSTADKRKGFKELTQALNKLTLDENVMLVIFGTSEVKLSKKIEDKYDIRCLGFINDDLTLRISYSSADLMIVPSLEENLSNTIVESLACNTPVLSFDIGGNSDIISHKHNGYLANYDETGNSLKDGIIYCLNNNIKLSQNCRTSINSYFGQENVIPQYIKLYQSL